MSTRAYLGYTPNMFQERSSRRTFLLRLVAVTGAVVTVPLPANAYLDQWLAWMVSREQERALGLQGWEKIRQTSRESSNQALTKRLNRVGHQIVNAGTSTEASWEFVVFESDQINAFALPGGKVGFFEGIFNVIENDAQLAAVLGHEVGHVTARHAAQRIGARFASRLGLQAADILMHLGGVGLAEAISAMLGLGVEYGVILPYSRYHEYEADRDGMTAMARAGYDPEQAVRLWQNMALAKGGNGPAELLSTHPSDGNRILALERLLPEARKFYLPGGD